MKILIRNQKEKKWRLVESNAYAAEAELQRLLAESPGLLTTDEIRPDASPFVVAVREFTLPVGSIDLLAFSAAGDIGIIECKLATNTQVKREVIGQVLDYAAHLWEMSYEDLDAKVKERTQFNLADLVAQSSNLPDWDEEEFRGNVRANLLSGNFILLIAVNELNDELSRIVRFVNATGTPAYAFAAMEMRRFQSNEVEMLVPRVFGPMRSAAKRSSEAKKKWDEESFFAELREQHGGESVRVAERILEWSQKNMTRVWWGEGSRNGSYVPVLRHNERDHQLFVVWTSANIEIYFYWYQHKPPLDSEEMRKEIARRLNQIKGVKIPPDGITRRPWFPLSTLSAPGALEQFLAIFDWVVEEIKKS